MMTLKDETVAYVYIKTKKKLTLEVAQAVSALIPEVRWVSVITGPYDLLAGVRVENNLALGEFVVGNIHPIEGVIDTSTSVLAGYFKDDNAVENGPP